MALLLNVGAAVSNAFGPTLIANFGFVSGHLSCLRITDTDLWVYPQDKFITALLNMPFGFLQFFCILVASYAAQKWRIKSAVLAAFVVPVIVGLGMLYGEGISKHFKQGPALAGYYLLSSLYGGNPLIVSWMVANTAGQTKKSVIMSLYNAGSSAGNIIGKLQLCHSILQADIPLGPLLFNAKDKPHYIPGIRAVLGIFCGLLACVGLQVLLLAYYNRVRSRQRVANGKPAKISDTSMSARYVAYGSREGAAGLLGQNGELYDMWIRASD
jgi:hypothetical protein